MKGARSGMLCLLVVIAVALPAVADDSSPRTSFERTSIYVPVRDGTRLALDIYRPATAESRKLPVVLTMTPYHRARRGPNGGVEPNATTRHLLDRGYVVAIGDVRGKGASFGTRRVPGGATETKDVGDIIEFLGRQSWSNGKVGMHGCSYVGMTVMEGLASQAPHLKAAVVGSTAFDMMNGFTNGGAMRTRPLPDERVGPDEEIARAVPVDADTDGTLLQSTRADKANNVATSAIWRSAPFRDSVSPLTGDDYWVQTSFYTHRAAIEKNRVPILFYGTWFDPFTNDTLFAYWTLSNPKQLQIGHGRHCQSPDYDLNDAMADFFDRHLKDRADAEPAAPVTYYLENGTPGHEWVTADRFPPASMQLKRYELAGGEADSGTLQREPATSAGSITAPSDRGIEPLVDMAVVRANVDPISATFTTHPFPESVMLAGIPAVHLSVSAPAKDFVVQAYVEVVSPVSYPDVISRGMLLASRRALGDAPYNNGGIPFPSYLEADVRSTIPGEVVRLSFGLSGIARVIRPGERIRLAVTTLPDDGNERVPVTVHYGPGNESWIELPLAPFED